MDSYCEPNIGAVNAKLASLTAYLPQLDTGFHSFYMLQKSLSVGQSQLLRAGWHICMHLSFQRFPESYFSFQSSHILNYLKHQLFPATHSILLSLAILLMLCI